MARRRVATLTALAVVALVMLGACSGPSSGPGRAGDPSQTGRQATAGGGGTGPTASTSIPPGDEAASPLDASVFAAGSCVALPPTHGNRDETVYLDAGHGGVDPGAVGQTGSGRTIYEADMTLPVELDAAALLRADGYRVVVSRTTTGPVAIPQPGAIVGQSYTVAGAHAELVARDVCANMSGAKALVGIYFDAGSSPSNAGCVTVYDTARPFSAANLRLARLLQGDVLSAMNARGWQIPDAGVRTDSGMGSSVSAADVTYGHLLEIGPAESGYFTSPSRMPGAIIEPLFITDPFEGNIADSAAGQHVIAGGIAAAVEQFLG